MNRNKLTTRTRPQTPCTVQLLRVDYLASHPQNLALGEAGVGVSVCGFAWVVVSQQHRKVI